MSGGTPYSSVRKREIDIKKISTVVNKKGIKR